MQKPHNHFLTGWNRGLCKYRVIMVEKNRTDIKLTRMCSYTEEVHTGE